MANEFKVKKGLIVDGTGTVLDIQGTQGQLFSITDSLTGDLFSVSDISGVPILNVNSSGVSYFDGNVGIGTNSPDFKLDVAGDVRIENLHGLFFGGDTSTTFKWGMASSGADLVINNNTTNGDVTFINDGNVGIGTTSPDSKLHIEDTLGANIILNSNTGAANNGIYMTEGTSSVPTQVGAYLYYNGSTNKFNIATGVGVPTDRLTILRDSGNVGIGTDSPDSKLHVAKNGNANGGSILMGEKGNGTSKWSYLAGTHYNQDTGSTNGTGSAGVAVIGSLSTETYNKVLIGGNPYELNAATQIEFWTHSSTLSTQGGTQRGYVNSGGDWFLANTLWVDNADSNVGIGTTSPASKLQVGDYMASNVLTIGGWYGGGGGTLAFKSGYVPNAAYVWDTARIKATDDGNFNGRIEFQTSTSGRAAPDTKMVLKATGNVGIGTTSPDALLELSKDVSGGQGATLRLTNAIGGSGAGTAVEFVGPGTQPIHAKIITEDAGAFDSNIIFQTKATGTGGALADRMTIDNEGNVGIGTDSPDFKLEVVNSGLAAYIYSSQSIGLRVRGGGNSNDIAQFQNVGGSTVAVIDSAGNVGIHTTTVQANTSLDVRGDGTASDAAIKAYAYGESGTSILGNGYATGGAGINYGVRGISTGPRSTVAGSVNVGGYFSASNAETNYALITGTGNVGIGTTSPNQKLHVNGATQLGDISATVNFGTVALKVVEGTVSQGPTLGSGAVGAQAVLYSNGQFGMYTGVSDSGDTWMQSQRNDTGTNTYDILLNPAGGRVAIGHNDPTGKLDVYRPDASYSVNLSDTLNRSGLVVKSSGAFDSKITFSSGAGSRQYIQALNNAANTGRDISINPYGGNVGIGTSAPGQKLTVNGRALIQNTSTPFYIKVNSTYKSWVHHVATSDHYIIAPSTADGGETWDWANQTSFSTSGVVTANNFVLSSDKRSKTKIEDLTGDNVDISWKSFEMKGNEGEYRTGVIAQELEENHPEFINTDDRGFKSVKYIDLLIAKIAELEARLEKLEK